MILFPRRGVFVHDGRDGSFVADPNHVLFFNRLEPYRTARLFELGHDARWIRMEPEYLVPFLRPIDPDVDERLHRPFRFNSHFTSPQVHLMLRRLFGLLESESQPDPMQVEEQMNGLVHRVISEAAGQWYDRSRTLRVATTRAHAHLADEVKSILSLQFAERLTLDEIAHQAHSSVFHLCRVFKGVTGQSIHQYLNRLRLRAALERLHDSRGDLANLAQEVGFSSHSHFTASFRREYGLAPSELHQHRPPRGRPDRLP